LTTLAPTPPRTDRPFYGWRMVGYAAVCLAMTAPGQTFGVSVFVDPMLDALAVSRSQLATAYLVGTLIGASSLPAVGRWLDRAGVRRVTALVAAAFGAALTLMAGVGGLASLLVGFIGIRMLGQGALSLTATTSVTLWFDRRRGAAVGMTSAAGQAPMSLAPLALAACIALLGWRGAWVAAAVAVWLVVLPLARWGIRNSPADVGQRLDGDPAPDIGDVPTAASWTRAQAVRTPIFWVVTAAVAGTGLITTGLAFHQISLLGERGLTPAQAAANFIPQTFAAIAGTLAMGWLVDRIAPRLLIAASMSALAGAILLAQVAAPGWRAIGFGVAVGAAGGMIRTLEAAAFPRFFGLAHIGGIRGLVMALAVMATAFGPLALALGYERSGTYAVPLNILLAIPLTVSFAALFVRPPQHRPTQVTTHG
jgi:MFS family permease